MSTPTKNNENMMDSLSDLFKPRSEEKETEHDSFMLMASFLSEIEAIQDKYKITRKELAERINITPSYLTQVFRGDKPLNFHTLAKIKRKLNLRFAVRAIDLNEEILHNNEKFIPVSSIEMFDLPSYNPTKQNEDLIKVINTVERTVNSFE